MKTDKAKHKGDIGLSLIECIDTRLQRYLVRAFVSEETDDERGTKDGRFSHDWRRRGV